MEAYQRQQFDVMLNAAVERLAERMVRRWDSRSAALTRLRSDPEGEGVGLGEFVHDFFAEYRLDDVAGAAFVLQALQRRQVSTQETVSDRLVRLAKDVFLELLTAKTVEALARPGTTRTGCR